MKYRLRLDLSFDTDLEVNDIKAKLLTLWGKVKNVSNTEISFVEIHKCYHDEGKECPLPLFRKENK